MIIYEEILKKFQKQRVKYVIVGGVAFNLLGGYRNTLDKVKVNTKLMKKLIL